MFAGGIRGTAEVVPRQLSFTNGPVDVYDTDLVVLVVLVVLVAIVVLVPGVEYPYEFT